MEREILARKIKEKVHFGSVTVMFYPTKVSTGGSEHKRQAVQLAADHESLAIINDELVMGEANPIALIPVWDVLKDITEKANSLLAEFSLADDAEQFMINDISFLTHGTDDQLEIGVVSGGYNGWIKNSYADFAAKIAVYMSDQGKVLMYGCGVAGETGKADPFALKFRNALLVNLETIYGEGKVIIDVWGHKDVGHTTANNRLVRFGGENTSYNGGDSLLDDFADWMLYDQLEQRGFDSNTFDAGKKKTLLTSCYSASLRALQAAGPHGEHADEQHREYTSVTHPVHTLIREIPYIGIEQLWNDLHDTKEPDYDYLVLTPDTIQRLNEGLLIKRIRFATEYAGLNALFTREAGPLIQVTP